MASVELDASLLVGAASSLILLLSLSSQVWWQYRDRITRGVSRGFFIGQVMSSAGFILYSASIGSWLFVLTNTLILTSAVAGCLVVRFNRRRVAPASSAPRLHLGEKPRRSCAARIALPDPH